MTIKSWDLESSGGGSDNKQEYTKFPQGITKIRIIDEVPVQKWIHWIPKENKAINCPGRGCPICEIRKRQKQNGEPYSYNMARRLGMQVINRSTGNREIMEQGVNFFKDLKDVMEILEDDGLTLLEADVKVKRRGEGKDDTSYRIDADKPSPLSESDKKLIEEKVDLEEFFKPHPVEFVQRIVNGESFEDVLKDMNDKDEDESTEENEDEEYKVE